jgi:hypothetical protein
MQALLQAMCASLLAGGVILSAGQQGQGTTPAPWPLSNPIRERGSSITGAFEGWFYNADGSRSLLVGYFNRNTKQELDIPLGANNRVEPGGPDLGQPTHFLTGRQFGVFSIKVPKDFGTRELTWTIVANGQVNTITMHTRADWIVEPFEDPANKNRPPVIRFTHDTTSHSGPPIAIAASYSTTAGTPLPLVAWATDEGPKINVPDERRNRGRGASGAAAPPVPPRLALVWSLFRGPGGVAFDNPKPAIDRDRDGVATATATFAAPGEYILRLQANDSTGDGGSGFQCCWTNVHVAVTVKPSPTAAP